jgi:hypothetical protein
MMAAMGTPDKNNVPDNSADQTDQTDNKSKVHMV